MANVALVAVPTYDTDYILVRQSQFEVARRALTRGGLLDVRGGPALRRKALNPFRWRPPLLE